MSTEFTPGPWRFEKVDRLHWAIECSADLLNDSRQTTIVAEVKDPIGYMPAKENIANARLIAAAPEMRAALVWAHNELTKNGFFCDGQCEICMAIAKAEGRQDE